MKHMKSNGECSVHD